MICNHKDCCEHHEKPMRWKIVKETEVVKENWIKKMVVKFLKYITIG